MEAGASEEDTDEEEDEEMADFDDGEIGVETAEDQQRSSSLAAQIQGMSVYEEMQM